VSYVSGNGTYISAPSNNQLYLQVTTGTFIQLSNPDLKVDYYTAEIVKSTEYSCYGVELAGWGYESADLYRYGFQDQETDKELWSGAVSYLYRIEDPRLGRFFSVDPLAPEYAHNSPYAFSENRVLDGIELEGAEFEPINENGATVDYRYVGYNDDGTPVAGSVSGGYLEGELGGMKWTKTFSSNASTRSGTLVHTQELASGAANVYPGPMGSSEGLHAPSQGMSYLAWNSATITFRGSNSYPDIEYSFSSTGGIYSGSGGICGDELQEHCTTEEWPVGRTTIGSANLSGDGLLELMESDWRRGVGERCFIHIPSDAIEMVPMENFVMGPQSLWQIGRLSYSAMATRGFRSFDDVVANPQNLWGRSADEVQEMLGQGWQRAPYGSAKTGWKFTKGDKSIFYHPGGGRHVGSYYGFSSSVLGKNKIVGPGYKPIMGDKAKILMKII
jgi:RHS repeat-associated protein